MKNWKNIKKPQVSVCCITYNHEPYIRDAIEGFLMQETDFPFEIIIHDDASTDKTADIVREYESKFPKLIKAIYQTENQYSKGLMISPNFVWPKAKGEYIALCEGDDYWTDPEKLQIQIEEMKKHPEVDMSFHPATAKYEDNTNSNTIMRRHFKFNKICSTSTLIINGGGFCPTASLMIKKEVLWNLPEWFYSLAPIGDYFIQILGSIRGGALYIDKAMSVYRFFSIGSWSTKITSAKEWIEFSEKFLKSMDCLDIQLKYKFSSQIKKVSARTAYHLATRSLKIGEGSLFKRYIVKSWKYDSMLSIEQIILFLFKDLIAILSHQSLFRYIAKRCGS